MPHIATGHRPVVPSRGVSGRRRTRALLLAALLLSAAACGKRGAPLPPLPRVPGAVQTFSAMRRDDTVELTLVVPSANAGGDQPGDIAAVEVYAITADRPPALDTGKLPPELTLVASGPVRRPLPPGPPPAPGVPALPRPPGFEQGERVTFRETLTAAMLVPVTFSSTLPPPAVDDTHPPLALPVVFEVPAVRVKRHYVAVAVNRRGRRGAWSTVRAVPAAAASGAPSAPAITYDAAGFTLTWTPAPDARRAAEPAAAGALESRAFGPPVEVTRYNVYPAPPGGADPAATPAPLNKAPLSTPTVGVPGVSFGQATCFIVRAVDTFDGVDVEGRASAPGCVTPQDTFAPPAPTSLDAVGSGGVISLIWEGVDAPDLGGYLVFRGVAGSEPVTQLTPAPIAATSFEDRGVTAGTRYVYVVVAVDSATPANRSGPSNRAEETARQ